jgi:type IV pilus assembly protein PilV
MLRKNWHQVGSSLIEVMIALFVLAIGLLGILSMQTQAIQRNQNANLYSQASMLASDMYEKIRANPTVPSNYAMNYGSSPRALPACASVQGQVCTNTAIADWDNNYWLNSLSVLLPSGDGEIVVNGADVLIRVRFAVEYREDASGAAQPVYDQVVLETRL